MSATLALSTGNINRAARLVRLLSADHYQVMANTDSEEILDCTVFIQEYSAIVHPRSFPRVLQIESPSVWLVGPQLAPRLATPCYCGFNTAAHHNCELWRPQGVCVAGGNTNQATLLTQLR